MYPDRLHIILTEDDDDDRMIFQEAFEAVKLKHTLQLFEDGTGLLEYLDNTEELPHIIFLDLNMPVKTGLECLREIRSNSRLRDVAIAIYSTSGNDSTIEETFIAGANIYIRKTKDFASLKKILADIIHINWQYVTDGLNRENYMLSY